MDDIEGSQADARLTSPAARRNREPIADRLKGVLPPAGRILEIASGSGEHIVHFAECFPALEWLPSDPSSESRLSILAWRQAAGLGNLAEPLDLNVTAAWPPVEALSAMLCINMLHIAPWEASEALFAGASRLLPAGAPLIVYGPLRSASWEMAPSNAAFDESLRLRDARFGIRDLESLDALAAQAGMRRESLHEMPANNVCVVWRR